MISVRIDKSNKCKGDYSAYVSFPYDAKIVEVMRAVPSRFYFKDSKTWEIPAKKLSYLFQKLSTYEFQIVSDRYISFSERKKPKVNFKFKTKPYDYQIEGFEYGMEHDTWLLGDEMGLGKTKQVIDIAVAKKQQEGYKHCLIICGVNGLKWNWQAEITKHSNECGWILGQYRKGSSAGKWGIGSNSDKLEDLNKMGNDVHIDSHYFLITNIESLRHQEIVNALIRHCKDGTISMIVADEIHKMKNHASQQGKGFLQLSAPTMIAMTGTPIMNAPLDAYVPLKWIGYENHSFYSFRNFYCIMGGYNNKQVVGYKHLEVLQEQLSEVMLRRTKEDVLDLPEKTYITEYVEMTTKQAIIYSKLRQEIRANIDQIKMANNPLAELIRLRQATGYTGILSSKIKESAKLDRMEELVEEAVQNGKQVVIFSNWTQMTDAIWSRLHNKYRLSVITGETKDVDRQDNVAEFQSGASQVIVGTIGAMGTGLTLTAGTVEIFLDEPWNMALKEQAVDRCHRVGQTQNITIYTLLCKGTIDERINEIVEKKGAMADALVDGKIDIDRLALLDYLIG